MHIKNFKKALATTLSAVLLAGTFVVMLPSSNVLAKSNTEFELLTEKLVSRGEKGTLQPFSDSGYVAQKYKGDIEVSGFFNDMPSSNATDGSFRYDMSFGQGDPAEISLTFTGKAVELYGVKEFDLGICQVFIDDVLVESIDLYSETEENPSTELLFQKIFDTEAEHKIVVKATGDQNPASFGSVFAYDYIKVYKASTDTTPVTTPEPTATSTPSPTTTPEPTATSTPSPTNTPEPTATSTPSPTTTPEPTVTSTPIPATPALVPFESDELESVYVYENKEEYTQNGRFSRIPDASAAGGYYMWTLGTENDEISVTFTGKVVELYTLADSESGIAAIYLDGEKVAEDNQYAESSQYKKLVYQKIFDTEGEHTIKLVAQNKKDRRSDGPGMNFDFVKYFKTKVEASPTNTPVPTATNTPEPTVAPVKPMMNGWTKMADGNIRYYVNDVPVKGVQTLGKTTYLFDAQGNQKKGWHVINGVAMYFNPVNGGRWTGLRTIGKTTYLLDAKRGKLTGWHIINGIEMYFDMQNGGRRTGLVKTHTGVYYLLSASKGKLKGWHLINGKAMYFSPANGARLRVK